MLVHVNSKVRRRPWQEPRSTREFPSPGDLLSLCPRYEPTPLWRLNALAQSLKVGSVLVKDESARLGIGSFKALGGVYAVACLLLQSLRVAVDAKLPPASLLTDDTRTQRCAVTFTCATDGNHGYAVAAGARLFGAKSVVFLPGSATQAREDAIAALGARIIRVDGSYDEAVAMAATAAESNGWVVVSDTAQHPDELVPNLVMRGYSVIFDELLAQLGEQIPTHLFVQAGVGGLAAAAGQALERTYGSQVPVIVVVEPANSNCLQASAQEGKRVVIPESGEGTLMAMLECGTPSAAAWPILVRTCAYYLDVSESWARQAIIRLAQPLGDDPKLLIGESGAAGLAGLLATAEEPESRVEIGLDSDSVVVLIGTEGIRDPSRYQLNFRQEP